MDRDSSSTPEQRVLPEIGPQSGASTGSLPTDLVERSAQRLGHFAWIVCAVVFVETFASHIGNVLSGADFSERERFWDVVGNAVMVVVSFAVGYAATRTSLARQIRVRIGVSYLIVMAFLVSFTDHADYFWRGGHRLHGIPGLALLIVVFPVLVPMRARTALMIAFAMAAMGPLAMMTLVATLGFEPPTFVQLSDGFPWLAAILAAYLARIVHRLGVEVGRARQLGAYDLTEEIGRGGMGEVWRAKHRLLARPAAIKLIRSDRVSGGPALERFKREAHATAMLRSPHTVGIYDYGISDDGRLYYVMELLDGVNLQSLIDKHGPQPAARVAFWLRQICHSLREALGQGAKPTTGECRGDHGTPRRTRLRRAVDPRARQGMVGRQSQRAVCSSGSHRRDRPRPPGP